MTTTDLTPDDLTDQPTPDRYDPLAALTISELDDGSRVLKASLVNAITGETQDYEKALAVVLWLHRRRADRQARLADVLDLSFTAVMDEVGALGPDEDRPTPPRPAP